MSTRSETLLDVEGMTCGVCVRHVSEALHAVAGVSDVKVDLEKGEAHVVHDGAAASVDALVASVRRAGYEATARSAG